MPKFIYHEICQEVSNIHSEPVYLYGDTHEAVLPNDDAAERWAARLALGALNGVYPVYVSPNWVPFSGLGDTVTYRKYLWRDLDDVDQEHATPIGELVMTEEPAEPEPKSTRAVPAEMHWAGLAIEAMNELCDRAEDAISLLRRNQFVDVSGLALAFGDALKKIGRAAAEREANKRTTSAR